VGDQGTVRIGNLDTVVIPAVPALSSLSPWNAVVGASALTLTVNGGGFISGATVLWNGAARTTTFVNSTQLTAAIAAADLAKAASVAVAVANPAPGGTSQPLTFSVNADISAIVATLNTATPAFTDIRQFTAIQPRLAQGITDLKTYVSGQDAALNGVRAQLSAAQTQNFTLTTQNAGLQAQTAQLQAAVDQLQAQALAAKNQLATPLDVANSFKGVLDQVQQAAVSAGGVQNIVTNMSVQLKAVVNVRRTATNSTEAVLVFPDPTALPPADTLSTVTLSFGAIPSLKAPGS